MLDTFFLYPAACIYQHLSNMIGLLVGNMSVTEHDGVGGDILCLLTLEVLFIHDLEYVLSTGFVNMLPQPLPDRSAHLAEYPGEAKKQ